MKCLILIALVAVAYCEIKEENDVLVVTAKNWDEVVTDGSMVLIHFCKILLLIAGSDDCLFYRFS